jgi:NADH-quinone oxidoreductase subunit A
LVCPISRESSHSRQGQRVGAGEARDETKDLRRRRQAGARRVRPYCGSTCLVLILAAAVLAVRNPDPEKVSAYECGFNAFDDARMKFDVRFYLVSILFIIFDLEVAFLFPWAVAFGEISMAAFWSMMLFLGVLTVGFAYEWKKGALEWE